VPEERIHFSGVNISMWVLFKFAPELGLPNSELRVIFLHSIVVFVLSIITEVFTPHSQGHLGGEMVVNFARGDFRFSRFLI